MASKKPTVVLAAMVANFIIMVAKFFAAAFTGSAAMLAEGIHSFADTGNQALLLLGNRRSKRPPDPDHPFGYGQEMYFWSLIVAIVLFGIGGGFSSWEGVHELGTHGELGDPTWSYAVLTIAFVVEAIALGIAIREFRRRWGGHPFWESLRKSKDPMLFVPLGEDAAALAGIVVAFAGIFLAHRLEMPVLDAAASIVIGGILCAVALFLVYETRGLLVGERMDRDLLEKVRRAAEADPAVKDVLRMMTMHLGPDEILLNLGVHFVSDGPAGEIPEVLDRIEKRIRERDPRITRIFIEPEPPEERGILPPL